MSDAPRPAVLICDDEPQILRALKVVLRKSGFETIGAETAREALDSAALRHLDAAIGEEEQKVRALEAGADDYVTNVIHYEAIK